MNFLLSFFVLVLVVLLSVAFLTLGEFKITPSITSNNSVSMLLLTLFLSYIILAPVIFITAMLILLAVAFLFLSEHIPSSGSSRIEEMSILIEIESTEEERIAELFAEEKRMEEEKMAEKKRMEEEFNIAENKWLIETYKDHDLSDNTLLRKALHLALTEPKIYHYQYADCYSRTPAKDALEILWIELNIYVFPIPIDPRFWHYPKGIDPASLTREQKIWGTKEYDFWVHYCYVPRYEFFQSEFGKNADYYYELHKSAARGFKAFEAKIERMNEIHRYQEKTKRMEMKGKGKASTSTQPDTTQPDATQPDDIWVKSWGSHKVDITPQVIGVINEMYNMYLDGKNVEEKLGGRMLDAGKIDAYKQLDEILTYNRETFENGYANTETNANVDTFAKRCLSTQRRLTILLESVPGIRRPFGESFEEV